jgi:hypothetical protein
MGNEGLLLLAALTVAGCSSSPPKVLADLGQEDAGSTAATGGWDAGSGSGWQPTCKELGKSVCACGQFATVTDPSSVVFVLDRSAAVGAGVGWSSVTGFVQQLVTQLGPRSVFTAVVFPDPQSGDTCAAGRTIFAAHQGDGPAGSVGPTTSALLAALDAPTGGGAPLAATLDAIASSAGALAAGTSVVLVSDGAPSCDPALSCDAAGCVANLESAPQCPAGGPPNCCDPDLAGPLECLDDDASVATIARIARAGAPVYVVDASSSGAFAPVLARMAQAGGGATATAYGLGDVDALVTTLGASAGHLDTGCGFNLHSTPDAQLVNVMLDGSNLAQGPDGWSLSGATLTLTGAACQAVLSASVKTVSITVGCSGGTQ